MSNPINLYGDQRVATASGHGIDVASQRADDLDLLAINRILAQMPQGQGVRALDAGCGHGGQAARMAKAGAQVLAIDIEDYSHQVSEAMQRIGAGGAFAFRHLAVEEKPELGPIDVIVCQRMIHYLRHDVARETIEWFRHLAGAGGQLFISASGLDSELGNGYEGKEVPVVARFAKLAPAMAEKHSIYPPVCLYRLQELEELVTAAGWAVDKAFLSPFGNVKIVATRSA